MSTLEPVTIPAALEPPPGVDSNFIDPYNTDSTIYGTLGICIGITSIFVLLRLYTKLFIIRKHGWEDYTILVAWLAFIAYIVLAYQNALQIFYNPLIFITKLSILLQYLVIFVPNSAGKTYWAIHFVIWANLLFYLAVMLVQIFQCQPREKTWNPLMPGHCVDLAAVLIAEAVINVISDLSILVLPVAKIWKLQMRTSKKHSISIVFGTGLLYDPSTLLLLLFQSPPSQISRHNSHGLANKYHNACIASIMRMVNNVQYAQTSDLTYRLTAVALWTLGEIASGIICSCLTVVPAFPSLHAKSDFVV
ncbi:MAG: hypothetical protein Q9226_003401 [Calogaya cf. arnoldii]